MNVIARIAAAMSLAMLFAACDQNTNNGNDNASVREVVVETRTVSSQSFKEVVRVNGTVEALEDAMISAEVPGRVQSIVDRGARIGKGEILFHLDDRMIRSSLEMARANYELAEDVLRRQEPLLRDSIISIVQYNQIRTQRDQALAQLEQAKKQIGDTRMEAPFAGRVEDRMVSVGELVNPGIPVLRLVNLDRVRINAGVPERYVNDIREGTPVSISLRSYSGEVLEGRVRYAGSLIIPETRTFPVEIVLDNRQLLLKPEMVVPLSITRKVWEDAIVVPRSALVRDEDGLLLFVVVRDGDFEMARIRRVKTGAASGDMIIVEEGIQPGDQVIVNGQTNVSDGDFVRIRHRHGDQSPS